MRSFVLNLVRKNELSDATGGRVRNLATMNQFPQTIEAIEDGIDRGLHSGLQIYVSQRGRVLLNVGVGQSTPGRLMTSDTIMLWRSAGKPLTAATICRFADRGYLSLDDNVARFWSDVSEHPIGSVTLRQLLTHQSGMTVNDSGWPYRPWTEILQNLMHINVGSGEAAYQPQTTWFLLAELLQRIDPHQRLFGQIVHDEILSPCGIAEVWCGLPPEVTTLESRLPVIYELQQGQLVESEFHTPAFITEASPGGNYRGPISELGRFYELLLRRGKSVTGEEVLNEQTVAEMTAPQRVGAFDSTFQHTVDFGLGLIVDSNQYGPDSVPYGFGRHCSTRTFGHGGAQCAMGFCDPAHELVVAWAANGFCGEGRHQQRNRVINESIYADLGIAR